MNRFFAFLRTLRWPGGGALTVGGRRATQLDLRFLDTAQIETESAGMGEYSIADVGKGLGLWKYIDFSNCFEPKIGFACNFGRKKECLCTFCRVEKCINDEETESPDIRSLFYGIFTHEHRLYTVYPPDRRQVGARISHNLVDGNFSRRQHHRIALLPTWPRPTILRRHSTSQPPARTSEHKWMARMLLLWITVSACSSSTSAAGQTARRRSLSSDSVVSIKEKTKQTSGWSPSRQRRKERLGSLSLWLQAVQIAEMK